MGKARRGFMRLCAGGCWPVALAATGAAQVTPGHVDTFQDGTAENWAFGHGVPQVVPTGGPAGAGDQYLQMTASGGSGAGGKLIIFNDKQWTGNYLSTGVISVGMDLLDLGDAPLTMRVALQSGFGLSSGYASTNGFALPADGAWHHASFVLNDTNLTALNGPPVLNDFLSSVGDFRILESANPALMGDTINASVGVDNITARQAVPGDADRDGKVTFSDLNILISNFGRSGVGFSGGDFNGDGVVTFADFNLLASHFGQPLTPAQAAAVVAFGQSLASNPSEQSAVDAFATTFSSVPEPTNLILPAILLATTRRRRRP